MRAGSGDGVVLAQDKGSVCLRNSVLLSNFRNAFEAFNLKGLKMSTVVLSRVLNFIVQFGEIRLDRMKCSSFYVMVFKDLIA